MDQAAADAEECSERRQAELEFISAAYNPHTEAWHDVNATGDPTVHRLLLLPLKDNENSDEDETDDSSSLRVHVTLTMPQTYPISDNEPLQVSAQLCDESSTSNSSSTTERCSTTERTRQRKCALNALPRLIDIAQRVATDNVGAEAVFMVLSRVEEWVFQGEWFDFYRQVLQDDYSSTRKQDDEQRLQTNTSPVVVTFGRRLIYSHHIISKIKRADIKSLASEFQLTGYMKIGWPGLLIIEGREDDCLAFYDEIRGWNWQYLVVRGEQQDSIIVASTSTVEQSITSHRKFDQFQEVDDMSVVAQHCRTVGLEALFRTSMKVYDHSSAAQSGTDSASISTNNTSPACHTYGALVHVDHMNDPKGYQKWLRKTAKETYCHLIIKQSYEKDDYSKRPKIVVGIVGDSSDEVASFLKRWRTSRVDVDSRGKACLERQISILQEGPLSSEEDNSYWEQSMAEDPVTTSDKQLGELLLRVGGSSWRDSFDSLLLL